MRTLKTAPLVALGAVALMALTGCAGGGSTAAGTYYGEMSKKGTVTDGIIVLDGDTLTWAEVSCDDTSTPDLADSDTSVGTLDKDRAMVAWTTEGRFSGSDPFTESEDGSVITMGDYTFSRTGTATADALVKEIEAGCAESAEREENRETAQAEQAEADEKLKPTFDKALAALLAADPDSLRNEGEIGSILAENGMTEDEFTGYMERNYNGLPAVEFYGALMSGSGQELLEEMRG